MRRAKGPLKADGYDLYTETKASGFSRAAVTFSNPTGQLQTIHSFFKPLRKDVQVSEHAR